MFIIISSSSSRSSSRSSSSSSSSSATLMITTTNNANSITISIINIISTLIVIIAYASCQPSWLRSIHCPLNGDPKRGTANVLRNVELNENGAMSKSNRSNNYHILYHIIL